jgi:hypothetical protein
MVQVCLGYVQLVIRKMALETAFDVHGGCGMVIAWWEQTSRASAGVESRGCLHCSECKLFEGLERVLCYAGVSSTCYFGGDEVSALLDCRMSRFVGRRRLVHA